MIHEFNAITQKTEIMRCWGDPKRRAGLARMVNGRCWIFDRPSEAIGHPSTVPAYPANYKPSNLQG